MKKLLLSLSALAVVSAASAQVYSESFTNPAGWTAATAWTTIDADGDEKAWGIANYANNPTLAAQGNCAASASWDATDGPLTPDNFFISPPINLSSVTGAVTLQWKVAGVDPDFADEHYAVYAVSSIAALATATPILEETNTAAGVWAVKSANMSSMAGQDSVYVVFRHFESSDKFVLAIDDVNVLNTTLGVEENVVNASVFPNPANSVLNVTASEEIANITIVTMDGKVVASADAASVNVAELNTGMYIYNVTTVSGAKANGTFAKN